MRLFFKSKVAIVMEMGQMELHVMTMEYATVNPISWVTNAINVIMVFTTFQYVKVINILLRHLYKNYLTFFILLSKLVIVMQMAQQILPVMATVYVIVNPISRMTNVTHAVLGFLILVLVKVRNTVEVNLYRSLNN